MLLKLIIILDTYSYSKMLFESTQKTFAQDLLLILHPLDLLDQHHTPQVKCEKIAHLLGDC